MSHPKQEETSPVVFEELKPKLEILCYDDHIQCTNWIRIGNCQTNDFLRKECRFSCNTCELKEETMVEETPEVPPEMTAEKAEVLKAFKKY